MVSRILGCDEMSVMFLGLTSMKNWIALVLGERVSAVMRLVMGRMGEAVVQ